MRRLRVAVVKLLNSNDEIVDASTVGAVNPLATVADAVYFVVESDCAAKSDICLLEISFILAYN